MVCIVQTIYDEMMDIFLLILYDSNFNIFVSSFSVNIGAASIFLYNIRSDNSVIM